MTTHTNLLSSATLATAAHTPHLDVVSAQAAAAEHVVHAAGGADHDVHASAQDAGILAHGGTTHAGVALDLRMGTPWCVSSGMVRQQVLQAWALRMCRLLGRGN